MHTRHLTLVLAAAALALPAPAADETTVVQDVIVSAARLETPPRQVGSTVTVITAADIERKGATCVVEALRDVPGLDVVQAGGRGQQASVFLRGANSDHTKVIIDGIYFGDPSLNNRSFDFAHLDVEDIERIEVLRGPQSVLYGSDAIGGVVVIITKRGRGRAGGYFKWEAGSFETFRESLGLAGSFRWFDYRVTLTRTDTAGFSAASTGSERDRYRATTFSTKLGVTPCENFETVAVFKFTSTNAELDTFGFDEPDYESPYRQVVVRLEPRLTLLDGLWEQKFGFSHVKTVRRYDDNASPPFFSSARDSYTGTRTRLDWQHNLYLHETNTLTFGVETEEEGASWDTAFSTFSRQTNRTCSYYVQDRIGLWDCWFTTVGVRWDDHEAAGSAFTYRIVSAFVIDRTGTKIKGSIGTGFKAPTLYQLYENSMWVQGNAGLEAEESLGWEVGVEQKLLNDTLSVEAVYFKQKFDNLITTQMDAFWVSHFVNLPKASAQGVELTVSYRPCETLWIDANYTYTRTVDEQSGDDLLRRPRHKFNVDVTCRPIEKLALTAGVGFAGSSVGVGQTRLAKHAVWRAGGTYELTDKIALFGRIENAFDEHYQTANNVNTPGLSAYGGLKLSY